MRENRKDITRSTREYFEKGMRGHKAVHDITLLHDDVYRIERTDDRPDLKVLIADIYICGEADIFDITSSFYSLDCIVLVGFYNRYSRSAKELALENNVGLYDMREFYGAIHLCGNRMLNYVKKDE